MSRVIDFYAKPGCHLCEDALPVVEAEAERAGAHLRVHDILSDPELQNAFGELIPVVEIDGVRHSTWFVDAPQLRSALADPAR